MEVFLSVILVIILGGWLLRIILGSLFKVWIIRKQKEFAQNFGGPGGQNQQKSQRPEGDVKVQKTAAESTHSVDKTLGEYVDFEEEK